MNMPRSLPILFALSLAVAGLAAQERAPDNAEKALVILDGNGKGQKVKSWKFQEGTRRLSWLAPAPPKSNPEEKSDKAAPVASGPEALEFREENSTTFVEGILTLVPVEHLRGLEYDQDKQTVTAQVAGGDKPEDSISLTGTTRFRGVNKIVIEAEVDKGALGIAEIKFLGGVPQGIRSVRFPAPKAAAEPQGRQASVTIAVKQTDAAVKVHDLLPLYRFADGSERLLPSLMFKKTLKLDVSMIARLQAADTKSAEGSEWTVKLKDGEENTLTLLKSVMLDDKPASLVGLVGKVAAGYKLFPVHTIAAVEFAEEK